jgi:hypothetical protein
MSPNARHRAAWRRRRARLAIRLAAATALVFVAPAGAAQIHAPYIRYPFQNWDYDGSLRDNPVSIVFVSSTPNMVGRVWSQVGSVGLTGRGDVMTLSGVGGSRPGVNPFDPWTSRSAGRKGAFGCWGRCGRTTDIHLRTYGPDGRLGTQVYQGRYGYRPFYLVATIHVDKNEGTPNRDFGYQDQARSFLVNRLVAAHRWTVLTSVPVQNACGTSTRGDRIDIYHLCWHDGRALLVSIDG